MKTLDNFSSHALANMEDIKGGTWGWGGCFSFSFSSLLSYSCYTPKTTCYEPPKSSCYTSSYCKTSYNSCTSYGNACNTPAAAVIGA